MILVDGGQGRCGGGRQGNAVETGHRDIVGHGQPPLSGSLDSPQGELVAGRQNGRRSRIVGEQSVGGGATQGRSAARALVNRHVLPREPRTREGRCVAFEPRAGDTIGGSARCRATSAMPARPSAARAKETTPYLS